MRDNVACALGTVPAAKKLDEILRFVPIALPVVAAIVIAMLIVKYYVNAPYSYTFCTLTQRSGWSSLVSPSQVLTTNLCA